MSKEKLNAECRSLKGQIEHGNQVYSMQASLNILHLEADKRVNF